MGTTTHDYYSGHLYRVTGPTGAIKDYYSRGYQGPNNKDYIAIKEYATGAYERQTDINKNIWGEVLSVRQYGSHNSIPVDQTQHFEYNAQRRLCRRSTPEGGHTLYRYDPAGQVIDYSQEVGMGTGCGTMTAVNRATNYYDINGRLFYTDYWSNATEDTVRFYDANSNVTTLMRGMGSGAVGANRTVWNYTYNEMDQLLTESLEIDSEIYDLSYIYDGHGRLTKRTLPGGSFVDIAPDALGRDNSVSYTYLDPNTQTLTPYALASNMLYHPNGSSASLNYGNGHTYVSTLNNLQQVTHAITTNGATPAFDRYYTYDARGLIDTISSGIDSTYDMDFGYDSLGQLKTAHGYWGDATYTYDSLGNIRSKAIAGWNGTTSTRTVAMSYDNSNNRLTQYTDSHGPDKTLAYDFRGNVTALGGQGFYYGLTNQPTALTGTHSGSYTYDGNLRRVRSEIAGVKIFNVYDASGTLVHIDDKGTGTKTDYVKGAGMTLARIKNGVPTYVHLDHLGSTSATTSLTGTVGPREYYTPFGETKNNPASNDNQAGFTGHIKDAATGLNYMQARYYDPVMGRFLSIDPMTFLDTNDPRMFNRYAYTFNDPVNLTDPTGECPMCLGALVSAGLEAAIIGVEIAAGKEVSAKEIAVRMGSSAAAGAAGVGILTKVKSVGKVAGSLQKVTAPAGNGNSIKVGNVLAGGFEGAVSGATSEVVGAEINQAFGVGDGASLQATAVAAVTGGVFGAATGGFTSDSIGEAINDGVTPTLGNSVNAQAGMVESAVGLFSAAADGARREDE